MGPFSKSSPLLQSIWHRSVASPCAPRIHSVETGLDGMALQHPTQWNTSYQLASAQEIATIKLSFEDVTSFFVNGNLHPSCQLPKCSLKWWLFHQHSAFWERWLIQLPKAEPLWSLSVDICRPPPPCEMALRPWSSVPVGQRRIQRFGGKRRKTWCPLVSCKHNYCNLWTATLKASQL